MRQRAGWWEINERLCMPSHRGGRDDAMDCGRQVQCVVHERPARWCECFPALSNIHYR